MELGEIISDAIKYPTSNIKALLIYIVLGIVVGLIQTVTGLTSISSGSINFGAGIALGIIGLILIIVISFLMLGFSLDVVKFAINKRDDAPELDLTRQVLNGLKYLVVALVYMILPIIVIVVLTLIFEHWIFIIIGIILAIVFAFILSMAVCRLAKTDSLSYALDVGGAIEDLKQIGVGKVVGTIIVATIVGLIIIFALSFILGLILSVASSEIIVIVVAIVSTVLDAWLLFYENRVMGLLYSEIA